MKNLKIRMKLLVPHIFILALLVLEVIVNFVSIANIRKQTKALYDGPFAIKNTAETINKVLETIQISIYCAILNDSQYITDEAIIEARNSAVILQEQITQLKQYTLGDMDSLSKLETNLSKLVPMQEQVLAFTAQNKNSEALAYMENSNIPAINEAQRKLTQYIQSVETKEQEFMSSLRQTKISAIILLFALGATGLCLLRKYYLSQMK